MTNKELIEAIINRKYPQLNAAMDKLVHQGFPRKYVYNLFFEAASESDLDPDQLISKVETELRENEFLHHLRNVKAAEINRLLRIFKVKIGYPENRQKSVSLLDACMNEGRFMKRYLDSLSPKAAEAFALLNQSQAVEIDSVSETVLQEISPAFLMLTEKQIHIPSKVHSAYLKAISDEVLETESKKQWLISCLRIADTIYGVTPIDVLLKLLNMHSTLEFSAEELPSLLTSLSRQDQDGYVVAEDLSDEDVCKLKKQAQIYPYAVISANEMKLLLKDGYPSNFASYKELFSFYAHRPFSYKTEGKRYAKEAFEALSRAGNADIKTPMKVISSRLLGISEEAIKEREKILLNEALKDTRLRCLCGNRPCDNFSVLTGQSAQKLIMEMYSSGTYKDLTYVYQVYRNSYKKKYIPVILAGEVELAGLRHENGFLDETEIVQYLCGKAEKLQTFLNDHELYRWYSGFNAAQADSIYRISGGFGRTASKDESAWLSEHLMLKPEKLVSFLEEWGDACANVLWEIANHPGDYSATIYELADLGQALNLYTWEVSPQVVHMPDTVRKLVLETIEPNDTVVSKADIQWISVCVLAGYLLYEYIPLNILLQMVHQKSDCKLSLEQIKGCLSNCQISQYIPVIVSDYVVLDESSFDATLESFIKHNVADSGYYIPTYQEILDYAEFQYPVNVKEYQHLKQLLKKEFSFSREKLTHILSAVYMHISRGASAKDIEKRKLLPKVHRKDARITMQNLSKELIDTTPRISLGGRSMKDYTLLTN